MFAIADFYINVLMSSIYRAYFQKSDTLPSFANKLIFADVWEGAQIQTSELWGKTKSPFLQRDILYLNFLYHIFAVGDCQSNSELYECLENIFI